MNQCKPTTYNPDRQWKGNTLTKETAEGIVSAFKAYRENGTCGTSCFSDMFGPRKYSYKLESLWIRGKQEIELSMGVGVTVTDELMLISNIRSISTVYIEMIDSAGYLKVDAEGMSTSITIDKDSE